jgi:hypothetical protein
MIHKKTTQAVSDMEHEEYDATWLGGGVAGRFGDAFDKALGGNPL